MTAEALTREEYELRVMGEIAKAIEAGRAIAELNSGMNGGVPSLTDPKSNRIAQILVGMSLNTEQGGGGGDDEEEEAPAPAPAPKPAGPKPEGDEPEG